MSFSILKDMKIFSRIWLESVQNVQCQPGVQSLQVWAQAAKFLTPKIMALDISAFSWCSVTCENVD